MKKIFFFQKYQTIFGHITYINKTDEKLTGGEEEPVKTKTVWESPKQICHFAYELRTKIYVACFLLPSALGSVNTKDSVLGTYWCLVGW